MSETASVNALLEKAIQRREALARRDRLDPALRAEASLAIAERALALPALASPALVAGYWPMRSEVDCRPLMEGLAARGLALCLPIIMHPDLRFHAWAPGDPLEAGRFGTSAPRPSGPDLSPTVLLVPLAAFDRTGGRIGYGAGYYDRAIARLSGSGPVRTLGLAFACQEAEHVPMTANDRRLDSIVTERRVFDGQLL